LRFRDGLFRQRTCCPPRSADSEVEKKQRIGVVTLIVKTGVPVTNELCYYVFCVFVRWVVAITGSIATIVSFRFAIVVFDLRLSTMTILVIVFCVGSLL
jgi:hypothetical protein